MKVLNRLSESPEFFHGEQLNTLMSALVEKRVRAAAITGGVAVGKTRLAHALLDETKGTFPGGVLVLYARPDLELAGHVTREMRRSDDPHLLAVEEFHNSDQPRALSDVIRLLDTRPTMQVLAISQAPLPSPPFATQVHLGDLTAHSFRMLFLRSSTTEIDQAKIDQAYAALKGNPGTIAAFLSAYKSNPSVDTLLAWIARNVTLGLVDHQGQPLSRKDRAFRTIVANVGEVNEELLRRLDADPSLFYVVPSRKFELVVAEILSRLGYEVTVTPATRDGGKDIYAARKNELGTFLYLVECKRYAPNRPVGVSIVRSLHGVVEAQRATGGILATTSYFTADAKEFQRAVEYRLSLRDYFDVQRWLQHALRSDG